MGQKYKTIREVENILSKHVSLTAGVTGKSITTERTENLAKHVGSPQEKLRVIHIAGTSGKTSTCYYAAALLGAYGQKVGMTTSPHITNVAERVQVDGAPLAEDRFCRYFSEFYDLISTFDDTPSYFEVMMVFAYWVFDKENVYYAVIETGLGGLHDSSNIAKRADKVCVITDIGVDHIHVLGSTIPEIAYQKVGIIQESNAVMMYEQSKDIMEAISKRTSLKNARLQIVSGEDDGNNFLYRNWQLAEATTGYIAERDGLECHDQLALESTKDLRIPGRMDAMRLGKKIVVFDGAHNGQKMTAFAASFQKKYKNVKPVAVVAFKEGKDFQTVMPILGRFVDKIIVTSFSHTQDMQHRSIDPMIVANSVSSNSVDVSVEQYPKTALKNAIDVDNDTIIVTGSFYLIGELRNEI